MRTAGGLEAFKRVRSTGTFVLMLLTCFSFGLLTPWKAQLQQQSVTVFEIEIPELSVTPTSKPELTIPSANVREVLVHILQPVANDVDYSGIRSSVNGQFTSVISETFSGARGKLLKIDLKRLPGFEFLAGRNTVEVWAQTRRGRLYYASFVVRTATENRNEGLSYKVEQPETAKNTVPPEVVLLEPERAINLPKSLSSVVVKVSGVATSATEVKQVMVGGKDVPLKRGAQVALRGLGLANEDKRVSFETSVNVTAGANEIAIVARDINGNRTIVSVPILRAGTELVSEFKGRKYALIIGISRFKNNKQGIPNLNFADVDARAIQQFLQLPIGGDFSSDDIRLLLNEDATVRNIREAFTSFIAQPGPDDLLLIFVAGHGAPDLLAPQNLYVLANDTDLNRMPETAIAMPDLRQYIERYVRARRVVLLIDTCHSAGLSTEVTRAVGNNLINQYFEKYLYREEGRAIITSSDVNEYSRESTKWGNGHGVFTHYLLEGLKGTADVNEDRLVSLGELFRFVRQKVRLDTQFQQNPRMLLGENENVALAYVTARRR
jgi:hypothetical protein